MRGIEPKLVESAVSTFYKIKKTSLYSDHLARYKSVCDQDE